MAAPWLDLIFVLFAAQLNAAASMGGTVVSRACLHLHPCNFCFNSRILEVNFYMEFVKTSIMNIMKLWTFTFSFNEVISSITFDK